MVSPYRYCLEQGGVITFQDHFNSVQDVILLHIYHFIASCHRYINATKFNVFCLDSTNGTLAV